VLLLKKTLPSRRRIDSILFKAAQLVSGIRTDNQKRYLGKAPKHLISYKLINNSSSSDKRNHDNDGDQMSDVN